LRPRPSNPNTAEWERSRRLPREAIVAAAEVGLCGLVVPVELGGQGLSIAELAQVLAILASADLGFTFSLT
jgi:alkylation response protein AidB-like acyl-CoA dehydrogenase